MISFNHGHWDAKNDKASYQANLEKVIRELKKTSAKLIWVTTCLVPSGYPMAGEHEANGKAPGREAGVMKKYLNPWALEVIKILPKISICDQWHFVKDNKGDLYKDWWAGKSYILVADACAGTDRARQLSSPRRARSSCKPNCRARRRGSETMARKYYCHASGGELLTCFFCKWRPQPSRQGCWKSIRMMKPKRFRMLDFA